MTAIGHGGIEIPTEGEVLPGANEKFVTSVMRREDAAAVVARLTVTSFRRLEEEASLLVRLHAGPPAEVADAVTGTPEVVVVVALHWTTEQKGQICSDQEAVLLAVTGVDGPTTTAQSDVATTIVLRTERIA